MSTADFEQRAASAGAALRAAFLEQPTGEAARTRSSAPTPAAVLAPVLLRPAAAPGRRRWAVPGAAALAAAAAAAGLFALSAQDREPADLLVPPAQRETAVLSAPFLVGGGTLPDSPRHSVQAFRVPFTFAVPDGDAGGRSWRYRVSEQVEVGQGRNGVLVLAPTGTYEPGRTWQGQAELEPAPTDGDGWVAWLEATGYVDVAERRDLLVGGAPATRLTVALGELPSEYGGCGGGRTCLAIEPMLDPQVGPPRVGTGPQAGIDASTAEMTVIEVDGRAVVVLSTGDLATAEQWLPTMRELVESLRFP